MRQIQFSNIIWDTDGKVVDLPTEVTLDIADDVDINNDGADLLSDKFGWCVQGFCWDQAQAPSTPAPATATAKLDALGHPHTASELDN